MDSGITNWNATVRCKQVWSAIDNRGFIIGNTYKIINGKLQLSNKTESNLTFTCLEDLNGVYYAIFEEVTSNENS